MKCTVCKIDYPEGLVQPMSMNTGIIRCCGICALEESNKALGVNRTKFTGTMAEKARLGAIKFRETIKK